VAVINRKNCSQHDAHIGGAMKKSKPDQVVADPSSYVSAWLDSPEGQRDVTKAVEEGIKMSEELSQARSVSSKWLREPFTV